MRILVLGSGAREHAIVKALLAENAGHDITVAPGNAGISQDVACAEIEATDPHATQALAEEIRAELVVIGPEAPLVAGVADSIRAAGIPVFGPSAAAAALEGSKDFAKRIMSEALVPTGRAVSALTLPEVESALDEFGPPFVVKADGLAAGKGVLVTSDREAALHHAAHWLGMGPVLVEEFLDGHEVSLFLLSDGHNVLPLSPAQDYKRVGDNDAGPNTGGMGAYSPMPWLAERFGSENEFIHEVIDRVGRPVIRVLEAEGTPFVGLLYCGLIVTKDGIRVIEFNARFGDPETQAVLPRLVTPLSQLLFASATGDLGNRDWPTFRAEKTVCVVLASEGYPDSAVIGRPITGLEQAQKVDGVHIVHAATAVSGNELLSSGGRVLSVVARADSFRDARDRAYEALSHIELDGGHYRHDIAARVVDHEGIDEKSSDANLPGWSHVYSGKVRDLFVPVGTDLATADRILVVASDRISAFDHVLAPEIPHKGELLTHLSRWWFERLPVPNHLRGDEHEIPETVRARAMIVANLDMFPIECVVRGYLTGSGWLEYQETQTVCGVPLPPGLRDGDKLPTPIYTPAYKAPLGEHDENITFDASVELIGEADATALRELSLAIFAEASEIAASRGLILADTKFEFGRDRSSAKITLADEVLTSDSSRYWDATAYANGEREFSFDKQFVRNWLATHWDKSGEPPPLPPNVVAETAARYRELIERMTGT